MNNTTTKHIENYDTTQQSCKNKKVLEARCDVRASVGTSARPRPETYTCFLWAPGLSELCGAGSFSFHNDPYQVILINPVPIQCSKILESFQDMEPDLWWARLWWLAGCGCNSRMSKVLKKPRSVASADLVVCASIQCFLGSLTPNDELPRSEVLELRLCRSAVNNSGGAPGGVASTGVGLKIT